MQEHEPSNVVDLRTYVRGKQPARERSLEEIWADWHLARVSSAPKSADDLLQMGMVASDIETLKGPSGNVNHVAEFCEFVGNAQYRFAAIGLGVVFWAKIRNCNLNFCSPVELFGVGGNRLVREFSLIEIQPDTSVMNDATRERLREFAAVALQQRQL